MKKVIAIMLAVVMLLAMVGCAQSAAPASKAATTESAKTTSAPANTTSEATTQATQTAAKAAKKSYKIGITFCTAAAPSVKAGWTAVEDYAKKLGNVDLICYDGGGDVAKQCDQLQSFIAQQCDVVILNPIATDGFGTAVKEVGEAGIPIIAMTQSVSDGGQYIKSAYFDNEKQMGIEDVNKVVELVGENAKIVLNQGALGSSPVLNRTASIEAEIKAKHPGIKILGQQVTSWDRETARTNMEDFLTAYGDDIDAVIAWDDNIAMGTVDALKAAGKKPGDVKIISYCGMKDAKDAISEGWIQCTLFAGLEKMMCNCIDLAIKIANGEKVEPIIYNDIKWITKENMADFPFAW